MWTRSTAKTSCMRVLLVKECLLCKQRGTDVPLCACFFGLDNRSFEGKCLKFSTHSFVLTSSSLRCRGIHCQYTAMVNPQSSPTPSRALPEDATCNVLLLQALPKFFYCMERTVRSLIAYGSSHIHKALLLECVHSTQLLSLLLHTLTQIDHPVPCEKEVFTLCSHSTPFTFLLISSHTCYFSSG